MPRAAHRVLPALLLSVPLTIAIALAGAVPAGAGGPTSVLLTSPTGQSAAALYYTDPRYAELEELLHGAGAGVETSATDPGSVTQLNLTWLIHDVAVWRVDRLMLDGSGAAWVSTTNEWSGEGLEETSGGAWTRLRDADRIREIVASLGLVDGKSGRPAAATPAAHPEPAPKDAEPAVTVAPPPPEVREETRWFSLAGWRWAVPGLLLGVLAAGLGLRRGEPGAPRQELVDRTAFTAPG